MDHFWSSMPDRARDVVEVARQLIAQHGDQAGAVLERRIEDHRSAGEHDMAAFWHRVARAVRALAT